MKTPVPIGVNTFLSRILSRQMRERLTEGEVNIRLHSINVM